MTKLLSEEKIIEVLKACPQEDHTQEGWIWKQRIVWGRAIEAAVLEAQGRQEREKVAHWMMQRALATGHGDTIEDMLTELEWQIREKEREACAMVCETHAPKGLQHGLSYAAAIRARKP